MPRIPSDLPTINPSSLVRLQQAGIETAGDVLKRGANGHQGLDGVWKTKWGVLYDWAITIADTSEFSGLLNEQLSLLEDAHAKLVSELQRDDPLHWREREIALKHFEELHKTACPFEDWKCRCEELDLDEHWDAYDDHPTSARYSELQETFCRVASFESQIERLVTLLRSEISEAKDVELERIREQNIADERARKEQESLDDAKASSEVVIIVKKGGTPPESHVSRSKMQGERSSFDKRYALAAMIGFVIGLTLGIAATA